MSKLPQTAVAPTAGPAPFLLQTVPANLNPQNTTVATGTATYEASSTIDATSFVVGSASTQASAYPQAGASITLQPPFHVFKNSTFFACIAPPPSLQNRVSGTQTTGASGAQDLTLTLPDPEGPSAIAGGNITFLITDANGNITQQCPIGFTVNPSLVSLADATSANQSMALPASGSISDSVCAITATSSSNPSVSVGAGGVTGPRFPHDESAPAPPPFIDAHLPAKLCAKCTFRVRFFTPRGHHLHSAAGKLGSLCKIHRA